MSTRLPQILAIDDDVSWLKLVKIIFEDECDVSTCKTIDEGLEAISNNYYDVVLLDINFQGDSRSGLDIFRQIAATDNSVDVVVISGETRVERVIQIMNAGPSKYLPKPVETDVIRETVRDLLRRREMRFRAINKATTANGNDTPALIGSSFAMAKLRQEIDLAVKSGAKDILLIGETGTGKEVVAKAIATQADPAKRMIPIHCGALNEGMAESELFGHVKGAFTGALTDRVSAFEAVGGGYIFLDEIGEMPLSQQVKLLRVLQERKVQRVGSHDQRTANFRCISATNANLQKAIQDKSFREDLYYRIAKCVITLPTLRERPEDIKEIVEYYFNEYAKDKPCMISEEALNLLEKYEWPGNVRQLQALIEALATRSKSGALIKEKDVIHLLPELTKLTKAKLPSFLGREGAIIRTAEKRKFQEALHAANGDRNKAAEILNISRATFFRRAKELGLTSRV